MAKEMLPIVDKPTIQFIVEEALDSGIEDILIVTGKKRDPSKIILMQISNWKTIAEKGKTELLALVEETTMSIFTSSVNLIQRDGARRCFKQKHS